MTNSQTSLTTILTLLFGVLVGVICVIMLAYYSGFIDWDATGTARDAPQSTTPGMDILNDYQCRMGESKKIFLGGIEDHFSLDGQEATPETEYRKIRTVRNGHVKNAFRDYDVAGMDKAHVDGFNLPSKTMHGIFIIRLKLLSKLKNDGLIIGDVKNDPRLAHTYGVEIHNMASDPSWTKDKDLAHIKLSDLKFQKYGERTQTYASLLEMIHAGDDTTFVDTVVYDDTMVDFMGFATCSAPEGHDGLTNLLNQFNVPKGYVSASCTDSTGVHTCNVYKGDTSCNTELPLMCFQDRFEPPPADIRNDELGLQRYWTGGYAKLTPPVRGDRFKTYDDAAAYCQAEFGDGWRVISHQEGDAAGNFIAYGDANGASQAWIHNRGQPYANCWTQRTDYEATSDD